MSVKPLANTYDPRAIEQAHYQRWEDNGWFAPQGDGEPYCIMIPPPNVTGSLHMGHAFQYAVMDALIRHHRMSGRRTLWQVGSDHAGIATQMVVERQLEAEGISRHDLGRERFIDRVWQWKQESGGTISRQLRRMGASVDWSRERFTMDEGLSQAVREVFIRLYNDGLIYRGKRLVNWDPVLHTAISDLEVVSEEENGTLWHIRYPLPSLPGGAEYLVVATTRPETMLGDVAVAVHPEDARYKHLIGAAVTLPLSGRTIPVIADEYVVPEFGSGCVKVTPAHDFRDYEVGRRHNLENRNVLDDSAAIELPGTPWHGLDRYEARRRIVAALEAEALMERVEDHRMMVPRGDRSRSVVEPRLTDQWFVKAAPLAAPAIEAVEQGHIRFVPEQWSRTYFEWMNNIEDWCISRQIWWGHQIPAWYDDDGNIFVAANHEEAQAQARAKHGAAEVALRQDEDVLDTWFSSALWPFSTLGWPQKTPELQNFYPGNVLVTGFDIIFFWVARMIMMGLRFLDTVPFNEVYIHGLVRDQDGEKMSKSKGNVLDPLDLVDGIDLESLVSKRTTGLMRPEMAPRIEEATRRQFPQGILPYGADALRFTFASMATLGRDIRFDLGRVEGYRNFCNKLWNATRFVLMNTADAEVTATDGDHIGDIDRWIIARLQQTEAEVKEAFRNYRLDIASQHLYAFAWDDYCSWYLELSKVVLNDDNATAQSKAATRHTLVHVLETLLRLLHPLIPFITEELWQRVSPVAAITADSIMLRPYPTPPTEPADATILTEIEKLQRVVSAVRNIRGEMNIEPARPLTALLQGLPQQDHPWLTRYRPYLLTLARLTSIDLSDSTTPPDNTAMALADTWKVLVPLTDLIDPTHELQRLQREIEKLQKDLTRTQTKLSNPAFINKAPPSIVTKETDRQALLQTNLDDLNKRLEQVKGLAG